MAGTQRLFSFFLFPSFPQLDILLSLVVYMMWQQILPIGRSLVFALLVAWMTKIIPHISNGGWFMDIVCENTDLEALKITVQFYTIAWRGHRYQWCR